MPPAKPKYTTGMITFAGLSSPRALTTASIAARTASVAPYPMIIVRREPARAR